MPQLIPESPIVADRRAGFCSASNSLLCSRTMLGRAILFLSAAALLPVASCSADHSDHAAEVSIPGSPRHREQRILVNQLRSDDEAVRMAAAGQLSRMEGTDFGYDPTETSASRAEAIERWERWLDGQEQAGE
jgi:hypothetical protein